MVDMSKALSSICFFSPVSDIMNIFRRFLVLTMTIPLMIPLMLCSLGYYMAAVWTFPI